MKLAIAGYGNLGKCLEQQIYKNKKDELVAIFSRRTLDNPKYRPIEDIDKYPDIDVLLLALGSYSDIEKYSDKFVNFDTVDTFDTHAKIDGYKAELQRTKPDKISVISTGWDPGLLSIARGLFCFDNAKTVTVWGSGISQGHSNAIRTIDGVIDAVQFTEPKPDYGTLIKNGETDGRKLHKRVCYVAAVESDKKNIEHTIKTMPDYFEEYETEVNFVSSKEVRELKKRTSHSGRTVSLGNGFESETQVKMQSNADFTASIMLRYANAIPRLKLDGYKGALDVFDIPMKYIAVRNLI